jgi:hypothetical protein
MNYNPHEDDCEWFDFDSMCKNDRNAYLKVISPYVKWFILREWILQRNITQSSHNPLAQSSGQVKLDSDEWKLWKNLFLVVFVGRLIHEIKNPMNNETWEAVWHRYIDKLSSSDLDFLDQLHRGQLTILITK